MLLWLLLFEDLVPAGPVLLLLLEGLALLLMLWLPLFEDLVSAGPVLLLLWLWIVFLLR